MRFAKDIQISVAEQRYHNLAKAEILPFQKMPRRLLLRGFFYANAVRRFFALSRASSVW